MSLLQSVFNITKLLKVFWFSKKIDSFNHFLWHFL